MELPNATSGKPGTLLKSTSLLNDSVFEQVYLLIVEWNDEGAIGFIINKPFGRSLHHLQEFQHLPPFPLHHGGPVDEAHLFFIHQRPDLIEGGIAVPGTVYWGGHFSQVVQSLERGQLTKRDLKIFVGYCGWDKGELEAEIEEGSWEYVSEKKDVFV